MSNGIVAKMYYNCSLVVSNFVVVSSNIFSNLYCQYQNLRWTRTDLCIVYYL